VQRAQDGTVDKLGAIVASCSAQVVMVDEVLCCGFAGDKGFNKPELNAHALRHLRQALPPAAMQAIRRAAPARSPVRVCADAYRSFIQLVDACASADPARPGAAA